MNLQSKYRLERNKVNTFENDEYYFAYQLINDEFHVLEIYIREDLRGDSNKYFSEIVEFIKKFSEIKFIVGFIVPNIIGSEKSMTSLLKFNFKILKCDEQKITLYREL
jgi:hypothetical protein